MPETPYPSTESQVFSFSCEVSMFPSFLPCENNRVWRTYTGGAVLDTIQNAENPHDDHFPEDWIVSATRATNKGREDFYNEGLSRVTLNNESILLKNLIEQHPEEMIGSDHYKKFGPNPQFLLKFLDSSIRLHLQCHPTIAFSKRHLNANAGKTEAYVILGIRENVKDPYIYLGFQNPPDLIEYRKAVESQDSHAILAPFEKIPVQPGDVFIVPGGLPHAIGEGVFMVEIMEPSDFAVRIEFERGGYVLPESARFMGRDAEFALSMFNSEKLSINDIRTRYFSRQELVKTYEKSGEEFSLINTAHTECFSVNKLKVHGSFTRRSESFHAAIVTQGGGVIRCKEESLTLKQYDRFIIPFSSQEIEYSSDDMELVLTYPPR